MDTGVTKKGYKGLAMEGIIASWYARTTFKDLKRHKQMAAQLAPKIPAGGSVLEIAPGPGYFCIELAKLGDYRITGLDISRSFVEIARKNAAEAGLKASGLKPSDLKIDFRLGNASNMPFAVGTFDFTFCQAAFKNFSEPVKAIAEMYRVLRPNGVAVIVDLRRDASPAEIEGEVKGMGLGRLNEALTRWTFKQMLLKSAYSMADMEAMISRTPFGAGRIEVSGIGFQVRLEKK
jgi:ubiquinone/menaquinone biosynthesis C-methylase UbiE